MKKLLRNSKICNPLFILFCLFFVGNAFGQTNTWDGSSNNNWNTAANWSLNQVPIAAHDVVIPNNFNVTVNIAAVCNSFTINSGGNDNTITISGSNSLTVTGVVTINNGTGSGDNKIIQVGAGTLSCASVVIADTTDDNRDSEITISTGTVNVTGNITMNGSANRNAIRFSGSGVLNIGGNMTGGSLVPSTGTVNYNAAGNQTIGVYTYNNVTLSGSGTKTFSATSTINSTLSIRGTASVSGTTPTYGGSAVLEYRGSSPQTTTNVEFPATLEADLIINNSSGVTLNSAKTINGIITLTSGALNANNFNISLSGNWINNGGSFTGGTSIVTLTGTSTIGGTTSTTFSNLTITGTITQAINTIVSGDFNQTAGVYNQNAGATSFSLTVSGNFTLSGSSIYNMQTTSNGTGATTTVNGSIGTTISGTATLNMDSGGAPVANVSIFQTTNFTASSTANASTGIIDFGNQAAVKNNQFRISGNCTKTGTTGRFYVSSLAVNGGLVFNGSGTTQTVDITAFVDATRSDYYNVTINTGAVVQLATGLSIGYRNDPACTFTVSGTLDTQALAPGVLGGATNGTFILASGGTLRTANSNGVVSTTVGAISNSINTRTFNNAANYIFNGTVNQNTSFPNATMNNLTVANTGAVNANTVTINTAAPTVNGTLSVTNGILNAATFQIIGNATNPFTLASGTTFRLSGGYPTLFTSGNTSFNAASTVEYYGATQTVSNTPTYGNLTITTAGSKTAGGALTVAGGLTINTGATFVASSFTHNVAGNWANSGTFTANTSTINLNGTAQSITGATTTFNNLTLATSSSTKTFGVATTISGLLTINTGVTADLGTFRHTSATLTTGGSVRGTGTSYGGGANSPAAIVDATFFNNTSGYLNVGTCSTYTLTSIAAAAAVCVGNAATINVTSTAVNLPNGTYTVFYTLGAPNAGTGNASMTVSGGTGSGSFTTSALANNGATSITINFIRLGCVSVISSGNTATITVGANRTVAAASSSPTPCISTLMTSITHATTDVTGIASSTGLPTGVTASYASNVITISGTPSVSGTFNYTITPTGCGSATATGTITVGANRTVAAASSSPTPCISTLMTSITHATTDVTGIASSTGLPTGVTASYASNVITISGTPSVSGTFNYTITPTGCGSATATGTITVGANRTVAAASSSPTPCISTLMTSITHATTDVTGIASSTGLPTGVTASYASNVITISGTPSVSGTFNYTITPTGCGSATATGTITVGANRTVAAASSSPTPCISTLMTSITHATTDVTGIASSTGLPTGVTASYASNVITISGTPSVSGTFNYTITPTGCGSATATGTITVGANRTVAAASSSPTPCISTLMTSITHATTDVTGIASSTGLPTGVTASYASNVITISGTPSVSGTFNYTITPTGCGSVDATGTITVTPNNTAGAASSTPTLCINTILTDITHTTTGATGIGTATGLPAGVSAAWASNTITISGTPTASGTFNYTIPLTGGCGSVDATGTITVTPASVGGTVSSNQTICSGTEPANLTLSGNTGSVVKWQSASDAAFTTPTDIAETSTTLTGATIGALTSNTYFRAVVQNGICSSANSAFILVTIDAVTVGGAVSSNQTICEGSQPADLTLSGQTGSVIKWESSLDAAFTTPTDIIVTTTTLTGATIGALVQDTYFRAVVQNGSCDVEESASVLITVNPSSDGGTVTGGSDICAGATSGLLTLPGHTGTIVRWESAVSPFTSWTTIANTTTTYTSGALTQTTKFRAVIQSGVCAEVNSAETTVTIATTTWTSGAWDNGAPTVTTAAVISDTFTSGGTNIDACSLTVNNNSTVIISSGDTVTLSGALTVIAGSFVTFNNNANLIQSGSTNANSGAVVIRRNSSALKRLDYTLWSSPVASQQLKAFSPGTFDNRFYTYDTLTNLYTVVPSPTTTNFTTAKGYLIRVPNTHPISTPTIWNGQFAGVPNNGDYTFPLVDGGAGFQFNLVGNPYPSPIDAVAFVDDANNTTTTTGTLYFWRKTNNNLSPSYCTWTTGGFVDNGEAQVFDPNDVIQTGQGFFVETTGAGSGNVNFDNSMRIDDHANQFFRTTSIERNRVWLNATNTDGLFSQAMIGYMSNAVQGVDRTDGRYINDGEIALTSLINTDSFAIQGRPLPFDANDVVPMQFKVTTAGQYTIAIDRVDGFFTGNAQEVFLRDNLTGVVHNLSVDGAYTFASDAGTFTSRFDVLYQLPLSIENPTFDENQVVIYPNQVNELVVNAGNVIMSNVKVFDIRGRLIEEKNNINASQTNINSGLANQVLLVQVTSVDGITITKKVIR
jgi:trimeric autotransporter adhesin